METDDREPCSKVNFALTTRLVPVYTALQNLDTSNSSPEYYAHIAQASRQYRSVIAEFNKESLDPALEVLNEIWDLFEIIMIDSEITGLIKGKNYSDLFKTVLFPNRLKKNDEKFSLKILMNIVFSATVKNT